MADAPTVSFEYTVEQLAEQRKLLKAQGKLDEHPEVIRIGKQIKLQQQARLAGLPGHVRAERAE